jgi:hypothetical protein
MLSPIENSHMCHVNRRTPLLTFLPEIVSTRPVLRMLLHLCHLKAVYTDNTLRPATTCFVLTLACVCKCAESCSFKQSCFTRHTHYPHTAVVVAYVYTSLCVCLLFLPVTLFVSHAFSLHTHKNWCVSGDRGAFASCMCSASHAFWLAMLFRYTQTRIDAWVGAEVHVRHVRVSYFRQPRFFVRHAFSLHTVHTHKMREWGQRCVCVFLSFCVSLAYFVSFQIQLISTPSSQTCPAPDRNWLVQYKLYTLIY